MVQRVVSLFSGIGGFEAGFSGLPLATSLMCEIDPAASSVLTERFPGIDVIADICQLKALPECDIVVAGWPCQDLSQAGRTAGISGQQSGLIGEFFRLIDASPTKPDTIVLENVAFALSLQKGRAIHYVTEALQSRGYKWAYRILDTREFGLPQRRRRIFICASQSRLPSEILFDGIGVQPSSEPDPTHVGFYWTEGNRGIGWTPDAVPPLKGGSALSIPSPPAIWDKNRESFFVPSIEEAERLQGFAAGWTKPAADLIGHDRVRWRLVGNAVSVPVANWIGQRLSSPHAASFDASLASSSPTSHNAAWGGPGEPTRHIRRAHEGPADISRQSLALFGIEASTPLSGRAASGFLSRYAKSNLKLNHDFLSALTKYCG